jgi:hypothetical protein
MIDYDEADAAEPRSSAWIGDPERVDPDDYPSGRVYVKIMTWAPCDACGLQVHAPVTQFLLSGLTCPHCDTRLLAPPDDATDRLRAILRHEDELAEQV